MSTLTADDRKLLREVFRAAHAKGWTRVHNDPDWNAPGSRYWADHHGTPIELDQHGWVKTPISEVESVDIQLVVDVLVAVGVLPIELRSNANEDADKQVITWRDYSIHQYGEGDSDVAVLCRSDSRCEEHLPNADRRYLTLGESVDWAQKHVAEHARWDAEVDAEAVA